MEVSNIIRFRIHRYKDPDLYQHLMYMSIVKSQWIRESLSLILSLEREYKTRLPHDMKFSNFIIEAARSYFNLVNMKE